MVGLYHGSCNNVYGRIRNEYINNEALSGVCCNYCHPLDEAAFVLGYLRRPVLDGAIDNFISAYLRWMSLGCPDKNVREDE